MQLSDRFGGGFLDGVGDDNEPRRLTVDGNEDRCLAFSLKHARLLLEDLQSAHTSFHQELEFTRYDFPVAQLAHHATACDRSELRDRLRLYASLFRTVDNRGRQRVLTALFDRSGGEQ